MQSVFPRYVLSIPIDYMSIENHCITIILTITENKNELSSIKVKDFPRQDKNFTNIDFGI